MTTTPTHEFLAQWFTPTALRHALVRATTAKDSSAILTIRYAQQLQTKGPTTSIKWPSPDTSQTPSQ